MHCKTKLLPAKLTNIACQNIHKRQFSQKKVQKAKKNPVSGRISGAPLITFSQLRLVGLHIIFASLISQRICKISYCQFSYEVPFFLLVKILCNLTFAYYNKVRPLLLIVLSTSIHMPIFRARGYEALKNENINLKLWRSNSPDDS